MFPHAQLPNPLPHDSRLTGQSQAPGHEAKSGLTPAGVTPPAPAQSTLPNMSFWGEDLVVPSGQHLICATQVLAANVPILNLNRLPSAQGGHCLQAGGEGGAQRSEHLFRSANIVGSGMETLGAPGLTTVQIRSSLRKTILSHDDAS